MVLSNLVDPDASSSHSFSKEDIQKQRATFALSGLKLRLEPDAPASPFSSLPFQFSLKEGFNEPQAPVLSKPAINDELDHQNDLLQYISDILQYDYTSRDLRALLHDGVITCRVLDQLLAGTGKATERKYMHGSRSANVKRATLLAAKLELSIEDIDSAGFQDIEICERIMLCILSEARNQGMSITAEGLGISQGHTVEHFTSDDAVHETVLGVATAPMRFRGNHSACASLAGEPAEQETDARYSLQPSILKGDHQPTAHAASISRHEMILPETKPLSILPSASLNRPRQSTKLHRSKSVEPSSHTKARQSDHPQDDSNRSSPYRKSIASDTGEVLLLGDVLGRGQFGTVYRAIDTSRGCIVAVKQIPVANRPLEDIGNMMKEIEILKALSSPYIVRYVGYHEDKQFVSIIVEYVENGSLRKTIRTFGCFNEKLAAGYTSQILQGLVYLHSKDVVHCDVKCANVLTTKTGDVKLSDFGISLFLSGQSTVRDDSVNGTPNWLAPEVISLRGTTKASDIWALGCTVLEMVSGNPPYHTQNAMSTMYSIVEDDHPPLPSSLSDELRRFLLLCFKKEPRARPTATELTGHPWLFQYQSGPLSSQKQEEIVVHEHMLIEDVAEAEIRSRPAPYQAPQRSKSLLCTKFKLRSKPPTQALFRTNIKTHNHFAVSTLFCRPVACRICGDLVRRAMYCHHCRIVAHSDCLATSRMACPRDCNAPQSIILSALKQTGTSPKDDETTFPFPGFKSMLHSTKDYAADMRHKLGPAHEIEVKSNKVKARVEDSGACSIM